MTREEAIDMLEWGRPFDNDDYRTLDMFDEAIDMAIEALKQEPCENAISRADVKKYLSAPDANGDRVIYEDDLDLLPPINPQEPKWIPISEKLPKDNSRVLVTVQVENREPKVRSGYYYKNGHFHIDNGDSWESKDKELVAWIPLLQPYLPEINVGKMAESEVEK